MPNELQTKAQRLRAVGRKGNDDELEPINKSALEIAVGVCEAKLMFLSQQPPEGVDSNELYKVANALAGLTRATVETRRFKLEHDGAVRLAGDILAGVIREEMKGRPELVEAIIGVTQGAVAALEQ